MAQRAGGSAGSSVVDDEAPRPTRVERRRAQEAAKRRGRSKRRREAERAEAAPAATATVIAPAPTAAISPASAPAPVGPELTPPASPRSEPEPTPRRARRKRAERRRFWFRIMPLIALGLAAAVGIGAILRAGTDDAPATPEGGAAATPTTPDGALLLVHRGSAGRADFITVVGADRDRASVLLVPTSTQVEVPSLGIESLADLPNAGDAELVETTIANTLGVRIADTVVVDDAILQSMLAPAQPVPVSLHDEVRLGDASTSLGPGAQALSAATAAGALTTPQPGGELDRLVSTQDVLDGWMARLARPKIAAATLAEHPQLRPLVDAARARVRRTDTLPVRSVATGGGERFEVQPDELLRYVRAAFPSTLLGPDGVRPRVEILNGTGAVGVAQRTAAAVVPAGGEVTLSGNVPGFGLDQTQVVYYADSQRRSAQRLLDALGCGTLRRADGGVKVVDVTILVGADCPAFGAASTG
jgi:hypothetical protein